MIVNSGISLLTTWLKNTKAVNKLASPLLLSAHYSSGNHFNLLWGIAAPLTCTLIAWPFRHALGSATILMTYNLGVFLVAANCGRSASILAYSLSAPTFAFFFAPPIFSFAISDIENIIGLLMMLIVANLTSNLLDNVRLQAAIAQQKENQATALYRLNCDLSESINDQMLVHKVILRIYEEFKALSVLLLPDRHGRLSAPEQLPIAESLQSFDLTIAQQVFELATPLDQAIAMATKNQQPVYYLPLHSSHSMVGVLAIQTLDSELTEFLFSFLQQIALTLERLHLAERAKLATIQAEAEASQNSLLSAISHDLRTPLTRIFGAASTLIDDENNLSTDERLDFHKVIQTEAQRMSELTNKVLDMARLAAGKIVLQQEWYAIEEIIGGALTRMEKILLDRPIQIQLPDDLPLVWIDGVLVQQVLINFLENIAKYTPENSPVEIQVTHCLNSITVAFADHGPGIPIGAEQKIFEKFYRVTPESSQNGIGLGLALCRNIIEAHAGQIQAVNRHEGGAIFSISLPLHQVPQVFWNDSDDRLATP